MTPEYFVNLPDERVGEGRSRGLPAAAGESHLPLARQRPQRHAAGVPEGRSVVVVGTHFAFLLIVG